MVPLALLLLAAVAGVKVATCDVVLVVAEPVALPLGLGTALLGVFVLVVRALVFLGGVALARLS